MVQHNTKTEEFRKLALTEVHYNDETRTRRLWIFI